MILTPDEYKETLFEVSLKKKHGIFLEIGCDLGVGSSILAQHADQLHCVDPWSIDRRFRGFCVRTKGMRIVPHRMTSDKFYPKMREKTFDLIYIDGDHRYDEAKIDFEQAQRIIKPDGIIIAHDCVGHVLDYAKQWLFDNANNHQIPVRTIFPDSSPGFIHPGVNLLVDEFFHNKRRRKELVWMQKG